MPQIFEFNFYLSTSSLIFVIFVFFVVYFRRVVVVGFFASSRLCVKIFPVT